MGLDTSRLEKVRRRGSNTIARCPACAEAGNDRNGEHLFINAKGQFGCVLYPGADGQEHRQRIFELAGIKDIPGTEFEVRKPQAGKKEVSVIQKDVLGHLGRFSQTHARKNFELHDIISIQKLYKIFWRWKNEKNAFCSLLYFNCSSFFF